MINKLYAIKDVVVGAYMSPWVAANTPAAVRVFTDSLQSQENQMKNHPEDFVLFDLGNFDDQAGLIMANDSGPIRVCSAADCLPKPQDDAFAKDLITGLEDVGNNPGGTQ